MKNFMDTSFHKRLDSFMSDPDNYRSKSVNSVEYDLHFNGLVPFFLKVNVCMMIDLILAEK